jgi:hypothetical protein
MSLSPPRLAEGSGKSHALLKGDKAERFAPPPGSAIASNVMTTAAAEFHFVRNMTLPSKVEFISFPGRFSQRVSAFFRGAQAASLQLPAACRQH